MKSKMKQLLVYVSVLGLLVVALASCATQPEWDGEPDIRGVWKYTLIDTNGNTYDAGVMTFEGDGSIGTWTQINFYEIEYKGIYEYGDGVYAIIGAEAWYGKQKSPTLIEGTWSKDNGDGGTFTLKKQS